ncbi:MAG TPA: hypothetical protein VKQ27_17845 [Acetobacteraceae bacterium]|nr:hypothetical protein [Acetobacteraceae bacterium]
MPDEFGIVANVIETDHFLRTGAKVWVIHGWSGGGYERLVVRGLTRGSSHAQKWVPIGRLSNFRAAWMPDKVRGKVWELQGTRDEMAARAAVMQSLAERMRVAHPNRRFATLAQDAEHG